MVAQVSPWLHRSAHGCTGQPMVAQVSPWLHRSAHGCTGQPMVAQVSPWLHRSAHGCTGQPMVAQVSPWLHRSAHGCTGQPMVAQASPWLHRPAHGCTGQPMVAQASPWLDSEQEHLMDMNILNSITPVPTKAYNGPSHEFLLVVVLGSCTWPWWQDHVNCSMRMLVISQSAYIIICIHSSALWTVPCPAAPHSGGTCLADSPTAHHALMDMQNLNPAATSGCSFPHLWQWSGKEVSTLQSSCA